MRIIIADRSLHIRSVLRAMLGGLGVKTIVDAETMEVALEKLEYNHFDMLIVDEHLPHKGAIGLLKKIQKIGPAYADLASIMMTARTTQQRVTAASNVGVEEILNKPFSIADLDARIKRCIALRRRPAPEPDATGQPATAPESARTEEPTPRLEPPAHQEPERDVVYI